MDKSIYKILSSGSHGNAVIYHNSILLDIGVPYSLIKPYVMDIQIVLLTHEHLDHFNTATIKRLAFERPTLRFACGEWMSEHLKGIKNIDILELNKWYDYGEFKLSTIKLYHDVENVGYRIFKGEYKIIHCTDSCHLSGITAPNYTHYFLEHNYSEETIHQQIAEIEARNGFAYQKGSTNTHLSSEQAQQFFFENKGENSEVIRLHESKTNK